MNFKMGIDLGGTSAKIAVLNHKGECTWTGHTPSAGNPSPITLVRLIAEQSKPHIRRYQISRVGVGVAGDIDFEKGVVRVSPNLGWKRVPLRSLLSTALGVRVVVDNDANAAAWGIYKTQISPSIKNVMVITLGTGVGGGIIWNGQLYRGATGSAGEVGHMIMNPQGNRCNCGNYGCLETMAGGFHISRRVTDALLKGAPSILNQLLKKKSSIMPHDVAAAAQRGDQFSKNIWNEVGTVLGRALGNLIYIFNPEAIYLTGGVAQAGALLLKPIQAELKNRAFRSPVEACRIKVAKKAPHIGVVGAALL